MGEDRRSERCSRLNLGWKLTQGGVWSLWPLLLSNRVAVVTLSNVTQRYGLGPDGTVKRWQEFEAIVFEDQEPPSGGHNRYARAGEEAKFYSLDEAQDFCEEQYELIITEFALSRSA